MNYNPLPDLLVMGSLLIGLAVAIRVLENKPSGATRASREEILRHQGERRVLMGEVE